MNVEFHYYTVYFLAVKAGFSPDQALTLGISSQMVDSNVLALEIDTPRGRITTEPTQNYGYWEGTTLERIYLPFHFFPGDGEASGRIRRDGEKNPLGVTPNSPGAKELLIKALQTRNLYRIGIALHTFADTWAHQNFSGKLEPWNKLNEASLVPAVGHAQAGRDPDLWLQSWVDPRLREPTVVNRLRFLEAARKIFRYFCLYLGKDFHHEDLVLEEWEQLMDRGRTGKTVEDRMVDVMIWGSLEAYDRRVWLREAVETEEGSWDDEGLFEGYDKVLWLMDRVLFQNKVLKKRSLRAKQGFEDSAFWQWHLAAGEHREEAWKTLDKVLPSWNSLLA